MGSHTLVTNTDDAFPTLRRTSNIVSGISFPSYAEVNEMGYAIRFGIAMCSFSCFPLWLSLREVLHHILVIGPFVLRPPSETPSHETSSLQLPLIIQFCPPKFSAGSRPPVRRVTRPFTRSGRKQNFGFWHCEELTSVFFIPSSLR